MPVGDAISAESIRSSCARQMRMQRADHSPPMASDTSTHPCMLTCKRVLQCESTCVAGEARTRAACVTSVLCTRVVVYRAQRGERGIGGGEDEAVAKPGAHIRNREIGKSGNREIGKRTARIRVTQCDHAFSRRTRRARGEKTRPVLHILLHRGDCNEEADNTPEDRSTRGEI